MKTTKKSLLASGLALLLCAAMLIGATFAWFTDTVRNTGNRIEAGELKVDLVMDKEGNGTYASIAGNSGDIFSEAAGNGILWEPGRTEIVYLGVQNKGSLALNYNIVLNVTNGNPGLVGSLEYALLDGKQAADLSGVTSWADLKNVSGAVIGDVAAGETVSAPNGTLDEIAQSGEKNETDYFALAVHMKESAGNEYKNGSISIDVQVVAKQATAEEDGFGSDQYDASTGFPAFYSVSDTDTLLGLLDDQSAPVEVTLENNLTNVKNFSATGDVTLNLALNMISSGTSTVSGATLKVEDGGSLTINAQENRSGFDYTAGNLIADGEGSSMTVNGGRYGVSGATTGEVTARNDASVTINSGIFSSSGAFGSAVLAQDGATVTINGGGFGSSGYDSKLFYANGGTIIIENCTISHVNGRRYAADNGGSILLSKTVSSSAPTSVATGCTVTDQGDYWLITAE